MEKKPKKKFSFESFINIVASFAKITYYVILFIWKIWVDK